MDKFMLWLAELLGTIKAISPGLVAERLAGEGFEEVQEGETVLFTLNGDLAPFAAFLNIQGEAISQEQKKGEENLRSLALQGRQVSEMKVVHKELEDKLDLMVDRLSDLTRLFWIAVREENPGQVPEGASLRVAKGGVIVKISEKPQQRPTMGVTVIEMSMGGDALLEALRRQL